MHSAVKQSNYVYRAYNEIWVAATILCNEVLGFTPKWPKTLIWTANKVLLDTTCHLKLLRGDSGVQRSEVVFGWKVVFRCINSRWGVFKLTPRIFGSNYFSFTIYFLFVWLICMYFHLIKSLLTILFLINEMYKM